MKLTILFVFISFVSIAQLQYVPHMQMIEGNTPIHIDWMKSSTTTEIRFNKVVEFINPVNDSLSSAIVLIEMFKEKYGTEDFIQRFICSTGDGNYNFLKSNFVLKKNESMFLEISLISPNPNEKFVFNIFDKEEIKPVIENEDYKMIVKTLNPKVVAYRRPKENKTKKVLSDILQIGWSFGLN